MYNVTLIKVYQVKCMIGANGDYLSVCVCIDLCEYTEKELS